MKTMSFEARFTGGVSVLNKLNIPVLVTDPAATEGMIWINSTTDLLKYHNGNGIQTVPLSGGATIDTESVSDAIAPALSTTATAQFVYDDTGNTIKVNVLDSPTVGGQTAAQIQSAAVAQIVAAAPTTLDTLNELAAALGNDPNFATSITTLINSKSRTQEFTLTGGALTEVVTHNFNTTALVAQVYVVSDGQDEDYIIRRTTANTVTVVSEGQNIPTGRKVVVFAKGI